MNAPIDVPTTLDLEPYWMPFTDQARYKARPKLVAGAKDMHLIDEAGRRILDGLATLWCVNAGHCRPRIVEAIRRQAGVLDFASSFSLGHPLAFQLAARIAELAPSGLRRVFLTSSGSEAVDSALKIALAYHRVRGDAARTKLIGRERGYHGVNFGGIAVGGLPANRKQFGPGVAGADHLRHTHDLERNAFSKGQPRHGAELADELETRIGWLHDPSTIAAVIVEPVSGSGGVLIPPRGYLERLREICTRHGILLIFDEVITGFGRLGAPFAAQRFGVEPDLITFAKGVSSGAAPLGGVLVREAIYEAFMAQGPGVQLCHGYTYSGHPLACAAALGALDTYEEEGLLERAAGPIAERFEAGVHSLRDLPNVVDCRNIGLMGAVELAPRPGAPGARGMEVYDECWERGVFIRAMGDTVAFCPPLIVDENHLHELFGTVADVLATLH